MEHLSLLFFLVLILCCTIKSEAQTSTTTDPTGPLNITAILEKAGQFTTLIRLLKATSLADQINNQLNTSNSGGVTLFAPTDNAFASLSAGTLNSLTDQQKVALLQFHVLPSVVPLSQFQTLSNPLRTQAGDANNGQYPLNVTTVGNQVNLTTGVVNTTVSNTIYSDNQLAVYQVDKVLLPLDLFRPSAPISAPAPAPEAPKKPRKAADDSTPSAAPTGFSKNSTDASIAIGKTQTALIGFAVVVGASLFWFAV